MPDGEPTMEGSYVKRATTRSPRLLAGLSGMCRAGLPTSMTELVP